jgi:hypothetical protein
VFPEGHVVLTPFSPRPFFPVRAIDRHGGTIDARTPVTAGVFVVNAGQVRGHPTRAFRVSASDVMGQLTVSVLGTDFVFFDSHEFLVSWLMRW